MQISLEEVDKIAKLSRLHFTDAEKQKFQSELSSILEYVSQLDALEGKGDFAIYDDPESLNILRDDYAETSQAVEQIISQAPSKEKRFFKVKSVLE